MCSLILDYKLARAGWHMLEASVCMSNSQAALRAYLPPARRRIAIHRAPEFARLAGTVLLHNRYFFLCIVHWWGGLSNVSYHILFFCTDPKYHSTEIKALTDRIHFTAKTYCCIE
jgi:hypothetical protein